MPNKKTNKPTPTQENKERKTRGLFDHIDAIYTNQKPDYFTSLSDADKKSYNNYMINKFLSMNPHQLPFVNELQKYTMSPELHYAFFSRVIPRGKQFNKYIKSKREMKYEDWIIELVVKHFEISKAEAVEYLEIYYAQNKNALRMLCENYGIDPKSIKKAKL